MAAQYERASGTRVRDLHWFEHFEPLRIFASGDEVIATLRERAVVLATGKLLHEDPAVHLWRLDGDGRVVSMRHLVDTQRHHDAASAESVAGA